MVKPDGDVILAVLPAGDPRSWNWWELFSGMRIPITDDKPNKTILPDGSIDLCYFVDFEMTGEGLLYHMIAWNTRHPGVGSGVLAGMLKNRIYPIVAEGVTVVSAPKRLWTP